MRRQETWTLLICILHACVHEVCMHVNLCVARTDPDIIVDVVCACVSLRLSVCSESKSALWYVSVRVLSATKRVHLYYYYVVKPPNH